MIGDGQSSEVCELHNGKGKRCMKLFVPRAAPSIIYNLSPSLPETRLSLSNNNSKSNSTRTSFSSILQPLNLATGLTLSKHQPHLYLKSFYSTNSLTLPSTSFARLVNPCPTGLLLNDGTVDSNDSNHQLKIGRSQRRRKLGMPAPITVQDFVAP